MTSIGNNQTKGIGSCFDIKPIVESMSKEGFEKELIKLIEDIKMPTIEEITGEYDNG